MVKRIKIPFTKFFIYICDCKMKKRSTKGRISPRKIGKFKKKVLSSSSCVCADCGCPTGLELHHILPQSQYPQYACDRRNVMLLCHDCHEKLHKDLIRMAEMAKEKMGELGIGYGL